MHCYVKVENKGQETHVIGIANNEEVIKVVGVAGSQWKIIQNKVFPDNLDNALPMAKLLNDVMIEAEKQRFSQEPQEIDFLLEDGSETLFEERLAGAIYYLNTLDNMLDDEVLTALFKDAKGRVFKVVYSVFVEYDRARLANINSYEEIK